VYLFYHVHGCAAAKGSPEPRGTRSRLNFGSSFSFVHFCIFFSTCGGCKSQKMNKRKTPWFGRDHVARGSSGPSLPRAQFTGLFQVGAPPHVPALRSSASELLAKSSFVV